MAGLGKYHMGGYGRIRVYRVKLIPNLVINDYINPYEYANSCVM